MSSELPSRKPQIASRIAAFPFAKKLDWLNTDRPIQLDQLKGKIVILDFWLQSAVHSHHVIEELKALKQKWQNQIVIIGVHSPKYKRELDKKSLSAAIQKLEIDYPIVNDHQFKLWHRYGLNAWPSFVLLDPEGKIIGKHSGEGIFALFDELIDELVTIYRNNGLDEKPLHFQKQIHQKIESKLLFPTGLAINDKDQILYIADTGHNRILVFSLSNQQVVKTIGNEQAGFRDGVFSYAKFNKPRGLHLQENLLYIADSNNHAIRTANFYNDYVSTIAGNGKQAHSFNIDGKAREMALNSPWDVVEYQKKLYVAMAGQHQIWQIDIKSGQAGVFAGSGRENLFDGERKQAALAQPSALTIVNDTIFLADSEVSAIRSVELGQNGEVKTLIGSGLFGFGDRTGSFSVARLQYPLGITQLNQTIYLADTYNHRIKVLDWEKEQLELLAGNGKAGRRDGPLLQAEFCEPSALVADDHYIYVADTNNHLIRKIDLSNGMVSTVKIQ